MGRSGWEVASVALDLRPARLNNALHSFRHYDASSSPSHIVPRRTPFSHPIQPVLCDNEWTRINAYRVGSILKESLRLLIRPPDAHILYTLASFKMTFEHFHGIRLDEREALEYLRQKAAIQKYLRPLYKGVSITTQ